jgi:hypothetical protein
VLGLLLLLIRPGLATGIDKPVHGLEVQGTGDLDELIGQLRSDQTSTRRYAARELRRQVLSTARVVDHGDPGSMRHAEMRAQLYELQLRVQPACLQQMSLSTDLVAPCADMLGAFQDPDALPTLRDLADTPLSHRSDRRLRRAIARIEWANPQGD